MNKKVETIIDGKDPIEKYFVGEISYPILYNDKKRKVISAIHLQESMDKTDYIQNILGTNNVKSIKKTRIQKGKRL